MSVKDFFVRWYYGTKAFASSPVGESQSKLFFYFFVLLGLFMAGLNYLFDGNLWLCFVMWGFFGVISFDVFRLFRSYRSLVKENKFVKGGGLVE